ncbi:MAG: hypothetical protein UX79_C0013G0002 [candidate division WWE3 bacterium GW2011_GWB1_47_11]|uniref:Type 4 fimbrial biogenesis protein PilX N-terminal domain-containing protein n=1 Tax=candidate division WWE3 bacterium GW2011_GWB1_47_11 TaxID=1619117 RepID=A0A0G1RJ64_UNCKA|nr:MAG: hypothetical protein UX79_C0013G0002 [candidate division WWE3 bacterium GW2011_GWB1_47_11]
MNQRGQALLFVIVVMSVALAIGVAISTRTLSTISRVSTTDTASRVLAAAEGGAERFLSLSDKALVDAISGDCPASTTSNGTGGCLVEFEPVSGDKILAVADVLVAYHGDVSEGEFFPAKATWGKTTQINLTGYGGSKIDICWAATVPTGGSDIYLMSYNLANTLTKAGVSTSLPKAALYNQSGFANSSGPKDTFTDCYSFSLPATPKGLRIQTLNADIKLGIYPTGDALPPQGYLITSVGKLSKNNNITATKAVSVFRSFPYLPHPFSFGVYSESGILD